MRTGLRLAAGLVVSLTCLAVATRSADWHEVAHVLATAAPTWTAATVVIGLANLLLRSWRWVLLLRPAGRPTLRTAFAATAIGFGASAALPLRIGEVVRPTLLARRTGISIATALSSVVLERLLDMLMLVVTVALIGMQLDVGPTLHTATRLLTPLAALGLGVLAVAARRPDAITRFVPARIAPAVGAGLAGLSSLKDGAGLGAILLCSLALWGLIAATYATALLALAAPAPLLPAALLLTVTVAAFVLLPQGPGFVGTWQAGCVVALRAFAVPHEVAVAYSLLTWILMMITNLGAAAYCLAREDISVHTVLAVPRPLTGGQGDDSPPPLP